MKQQTEAMTPTEKVEKARQKTTCPSCPSCHSYNADADGPDIEVSDGRVYEICPECWKRFETVTTNAP